MEQLSTECKEKKEKVEFELEKPEDHLKLTLPAHKDEMFRDIGTCKDLYSQFDNTNENLKILENLQEDLSESLAPSDIKQLSQSPPVVIPSICPTCMKKSPQTVTQ